MDSLYIVVPAYNEADNLERLVADWYSVVENHSAGGLSKLVVVDDGSRDATYDLLLELAQDRPLLKPLTKKNEGHGPTVLYAFCMHIVMQ